MASTAPTPFQRVFSHKDLLRGNPFQACVMFAVSSLLLGLGLIDLFFVTDLLVHGGTLQISAEKLPELERLVGEDLLRGTGIPAAHPAGGELIYTERGLLPTLWRNRTAFWSPLAVAVYKRFSPLQNNSQALQTLVVAVAIFGWLRSMLDSRARLRIMSTAIDVAGRLRQAIHRQTLRLGPSDLEGRSNEQSLELFTTEVDRVRDGVFVYADRLARDPLLLALLVGLALAVNPSLSIICMVPAGLCWYLVYRETRRTAELREIAAARSAKDLRLLAESLEKTRLVRGFAMETFEQEQFAKYLQRFQADTLNSMELKAWSRRGIRTLVAAAVAFVLLFVGWSVLRPPHELSYASGFLMLGCFIAAGFPLRNLARLKSDLAPAESASNRIHAYINRIPEVGQAVGAKFLQPLARMLSFEDVSYTTPSRRLLLDGLNLRIPAGRTVAIVSSDPLEALAVAYLLPRFIEPEKGKILVDNEDIAWVTLESLRAETVFVGGKDPFLTASIRENISGGNEQYSLTEVTEAAKFAHAHNFISKLPQGYETLIGEHGEQLDPGQAFRLGLARAILRKPAILIIEEPSTPLDDDTKTMLDDVYKRITPNRTVLFLARRLSTVKRCDEIVLIHKGRLAAIGPHARLVQSSGLYRHWEYINFNEFRHEFESE